MKKIKLIFLIFLSTYAFSRVDTCRFTNAITAGYVFKRDDNFKQVYGNGIINVITEDFCYYPWKCYGLDFKLSYFRKKGKTTFTQQCSLIQEVPITVSLRKIKNFRYAQLYGSLGGGLIWLKEKSYLGEVKLHKAIGEFELGLNSCRYWHCINFTAAFRYLFPRKTNCCEVVDLGGFDLRAGFEISF